MSDVASGTIERSAAPAPHRRAWRLRTYLIGLVALFVLASGSGAWYAWTRAHADALRVAGEDAAFAAKLTAAQVGSDLATIQGTARQLAARPDASAAFAGIGTCSLQFRAPGAAGTGHLDLVRPDGSIACTSRPVTGAERTYAGEDWLRRAATEQLNAEAIRDARTGRPALVTTVPVAGAGIVAIFVDLGGLGIALKDLFGGPRQLEFLVTTGDRERIITRSLEPDRWISKPLAGTGFHLDGGQGTDVAGVARVYREATVTGPGWRLYVGASRDDAVAAGRQLVARQALIVGVGLLAGLLGTLMVYRRITQPIARLSGAVRTAATITGGPPVTVRGPREVVRLGEDVNQLVVAVDRELNERRRAESSATELERNYRQLFDRNPFPMYLVDPKWLLLIEVNDAAAAYYGYPREEMLGMEIGRLHVAEDIAALAETFANAGVVERWSGMRQVKRDGTIVEVNITSQLLGFAGRDARCVIVEDVTERAELERRLQQSQRLESLGQLAGGVAHDFNNLLAVILGFATMAADEVGPAADADPRWRQCHDDLLQIIHAGDRATSLTRQLLSFARAEVTQPRVLDLNTVIADMEQLLRRSIGEDIDLRVDLAADAWRVTADPGHLEQVLVNLAVNARDAMPSGGRLRIDTQNLVVDEHYAAHHPGTTPGRYLRLRVSDTGVGMSQATLDRAFEPFFTTKPKGQGTGLGLATIYGIITQAGGAAQIYSEPGLGTTFTALLPATEEPAVVDEPGNTDNAPGHGETILLVEDEESLRSLTERMLTRHGYRVMSAANGAAALTLVADHPHIDLLLTDVVMPELNGHELATRLQMQRPHLPVIYLSGYAEAILVSRSTLPAGATLLSKPVTQHHLLAAIRRALEARQSRPARSPGGLER